MRCDHDPKKTVGPIGMYHCPECGEMVIAGIDHPNWEAIMTEMEIEEQTIRCNDRIGKLEADIKRMQFEDGGPAFPSEHVVHEPNKTWTLGDRIPCKGMTLWDYFAAASLEGVCNNCCGSENEFKDIAENAGRFADAMIAERKKRMGG